MNPIGSAIALVVGTLAPVSVSAALIFSDVTLTAITQSATQLPPPVDDSDLATLPNEGVGSVRALSPSNGIPFPNLPNSVGSAFASAAELALGQGGVASGVGVNGFFFQNSLPPNLLFATSTIEQTITNDSATRTESLGADFSIPAPTMQFFGVGNSFPSGADPQRDAIALVEAELNIVLTHPDGTSVEDRLLDYGMSTFREPLSGVFLAVPTSSDAVGLTRFDEFDGSFGFRLPALSLDEFPLPDLGPGDVLELSYVFTAKASTGFGETGIFAAIGDPFDLNASDARFEVQVVPEASTVALIALGLLALKSRRLAPA